MSRHEAFGLVQRVGCIPTSHLTKRTGILVVGMLGWPLLPDGSISGKLQRAEELRRHGQSLTILSETGFLELSGRPRPCSTNERTYSASDVCAILGLDAVQLDRWEQFSLVVPIDGFYDFRDLVSLRTLMDLLRHGVRPEIVATSLLRLATVLPGTERPLAQLRIIAENPTSILADSGASRFEPSGQCLFRFDERACPDPDGEQEAGKGETALGIIPIEPPGSANAWFEHGQLLEDEERFAEAESSYRKALVQAPIFPEACFNLGNVLREMNRLEEAESMFLQAVLMDGKMAWAWYNLGDVQADRGKLDEAIESFRHALGVSPLYADAHYNLATCLETSGRREEARRHWETYLRLDPDSAWAAVARDRLSDNLG